MQPGDSSASTTIKGPDTFLIDSNAPMDTIVQYNAACFHALAGNVEKSLDYLENCQIKVGNLNREWLEHDSDLESVRDHPRFADILAAFPD